MYAPPHRLDTPPPNSQFRRPWSPDPHDPFGTGNVDLFPRGDYDRWLQPGLSDRPREVSDVSVEALDLADYAMTLRRPAGSVMPPLAAHSGRPQSNIEGPYPPFPPPQPDYPPYPPSGRPFAPASMSPPPSLTSGSSSQARTQSRRSYDPRTPSRRPFSLPPAPHSRLSYQPPRQPLRFAGPNAPADDPQEIDIANFPAWSKEWYNQEKPQVSPSNPYSPTYPDHDFHFSDLESNGTHVHSANSYAAHTDASHRSLLPWSGDSYEHPSADLDPGTMQERMRMLEAEFMGKNGSGRTRGGVDDQDGEDVPLVGSVDEKGQIVTDGPRKRAAVRAVQGVLALGAAVSAIYGALIIKPASKPPPESSLAAFVLYGLSVITSLLVLYLFLFRPCCCAGRRKSPSGGLPNPAGMMVLPMQGFPNKKGKKGGKGGKKGPPSQDVQVNLIVDPTMFNNRDNDDEEDEGEEIEAVPGTFPWNRDNGKPQPKSKRKNAKRRSVFAGLALEERWKAARKFLRWITFFDSVFMVLWGVAFVLILLGKRCPPGQFDGWCTTYNLATAASCLLIFAFGCGLFFDVKDLHASRQSPRTRT